jgi:hypothetical protein
MDFEVLGEIRNIETFAVGSSIRELPRLRRAYGSGRWRKRRARPESASRTAPSAGPKCHWYEAHGLGRKEMKIKRFLDA